MIYLWAVVSRHQRDLIISFTKISWFVQFAPLHVWPPYFRGYLFSMRRHGVIVSLTASTNHAAISVSVLFVTVEMLTSMTIHVFILPFSFCYSNAVSAFFVKLASANLNAGDGRVSPQTISKISCFAFSLKNSATMEPSFIIICHDISSAAIHFLFPPHLFYRVGWMLSKIRTPASLPSGIALTGDVYRLKESSYLSQPVYHLCKGFPPVTI